MGLLGPHDAPGTFSYCRPAAGAAPNFELAHGAVDAARVHGCGGEEILAHFRRLADSVSSEPDVSNTKDFNCGMYQRPRLSDASPSAPPVPMMPTTDINAVSVDTDMSAV